MPKENLKPKRNTAGILILDEPANLKLGASELMNVHSTYLVDWQREKTKKS